MIPARVTPPGLTLARRESSAPCAVGWTLEADTLGDLFGLKVLGLQHLKLNSLVRLKVYVPPVGIRSVRQRCDATQIWQADQDRERMHAACQEGRS